jgi:hypothetical protein
MPSSKIANYGVDLFKLSVNPGGNVVVNTSGGKFRIDGDLDVSGTVTTVSSEDLNVTDNVITVNSGEAGTGVSKGTAGIEVDRGEVPNLQIIYNEGTFDNNGVQLTEGFFSFNYANDPTQLLGIYTNSIKTQGTDLFLLDKNSTGLVIVNSVNYAGTLWNYTPFVELISESDLRSPSDVDALVNAKALIDYVDSYHLYNWQDRIISLDNADTRVVADAETVKNVKIIVGDATIGEFTLDGAKFTNVIVKNEIQTLTGNDLILNPDQNVSVSNKKIIDLADPVLPTDAVNLQYLESRIGNLGLFDLIDPTTLVDGSMLVYNGTTEKFEGTTVLNKQTIDAGTY